MIPGSVQSMAYAEAPRSCVIEPAAVAYHAPATSSSVLNASDSISYGQPARFAPESQPPVGPLPASVAAAAFNKTSGISLSFAKHSTYAPPDMSQAVNAESSPSGMSSRGSTPLSPAGHARVQDPFVGSSHTSTSDPVTQRGFGNDTFKPTQATTVAEPRAHKPRVRRSQSPKAVRVSAMSVRQREPITTRQSELEYEMEKIEAEQEERSAKLEELRLLKEEVLSRKG